MPLGRKSMKKVAMALKKINRFRRYKLGVSRSLVSAKSNYITHSFKRTVSLSPIQFNDSTTIPENGGFTQYQNFGFTLASLPQFTEFTALYDQYKIVGVKVKLMPVFNSYDPTSVVTVGAVPKTAACPYITTVVDFDGVTATAQSGYNQYSNAKTRLFDKPVTVYIPYPGIKDNDTVTSANVVMRGKWIDTTKFAVNHNGLGVSLTYPFDYRASTGSILPVTVQPVVTYYLKMKNVR